MQKKNVNDFVFFVSVRLENGKPHKKWRFKTYEKSDI